MSDLRDPAIKLFGTTIPLAAEDVATGSSSDLPSDVILEEQGEDAHEETNLEQATESQPDPLDSVPHGEANPSSEPSTTNQTVQEESVPDQTGTPNQDKTLKKPDKILPCPRCKSMDTKFCYYNNYNVNQPRHFCKKCQRYWTAGGTMRNVPVGAGRRKNKHLNNRLLTGTGTEVAEQVPVIPPPNGSVMKFGPEMPLSESMVSGLNIKERENKAVSVTGTSIGTVAASSLSEEKNGCNRVAPVQLPVPVPPVPFYPGAPFVYPWNGSPIPLSVPPPVMPPGTGFGPPGVPFPFVPAPFWAFGWAPPQWVPGSPASSTSTITTSTGTGSPALGKHSRNGTVPGEEKSEKNLWVPKTLRIDDPAEAAKSSIWDTLGIKKEERGILGAFRGKSEMRGPVRIGTSRLLHANPAALSRSQSFQEST